MLKKFRSILGSKKTLAVLGILILLFQTQSYRLKPKKEIPTFIKNRLSSLGEKALLGNDVPVAAVILYNDSIIGEGYNAVQRDSNISSHAEIMALSETFKNHENSFTNLDRDKLVLYSTFEPCEMCKGAIIYYGIKHIYFEENKSAYDQMKSTVKSLLYNLSIQRLDSPNLQEELFLQHPDYPARSRSE